MILLDLSVWDAAGIMHDVFTAEFQSIIKACIPDLQDQAGQLGVSFEAPLREYVRMVKSAKAVMADRSLALHALQQARADVDAKRTKLAKLRGTPGIKVHPYSASLPAVL